MYKCLIITLFENYKNNINMKKQTIGLMAQIYPEGKTKIFSLLALLLIFSNCAKECDDRKDIYYNVDEEFKKMLPYTGFDTITFVRTSVGDTHTFVGIGKTTNYDRTSLSYDCSDNYFRENYSYTFISNTFNSPLYIGQYVAQDSQKIPLTFINFENNFLEDFINFNFVKQDIDTLKVLNTTYYKVEKMENGISKNAYFDKANGCIKIEMNNQSWELLRYKK